MSDYLGFITAVIVLVAAFFGLIPPLLANSSNPGGKSDKAAANFIDSIKPFVVIGSFLALFFFYMFGMTNLTNNFSGNRGSVSEDVDLRGLKDGDHNIVVNAELISGHNARNSAFLEIIEFALEDDKFALATLAASKLSGYELRNQQFSRIQKQSLVHHAPPQTTVTE